MLKKINVFLLKEELEELILLRKNKKLKRGKDKC